eukprot:m.457331 g.457331  ORF g.457331 m.457331 type:complete len:66 (-) comp21577_c0_seq6:1272-1469(-)
MYMYMRACVCVCEACIQPGSSPQRHHPSRDRDSNVVTHREENQRSRTLTPRAVSVVQFHVMTKRL